MSVANIRRLSLHEGEGDCVLKVRNINEITNEQDLAFAEYEWLAAVLDRVTLTISLAAVSALTLGVLAVGYAEDISDY